MEIIKLQDEGWYLVRAIQDLYAPVQEDEEYVPRSRMYIATLEKKPAYAIVIEYDNEIGRYVAHTGFYKATDTTPEGAVGTLIMRHYTFFNVEVIKVPLDS